MHLGVCRHVPDLTATSRVAHIDRDDGEVLGDVHVLVDCVLQLGAQPIWEEPQPDDRPLALHSFDQRDEVLVTLSWLRRPSAESDRDGHAALRYE
jgi:hypothetical protein